MNQTKSFPISKQQVWEAWKRVKANQGGAGVDHQTLADFERDIGNHLYKIWNRMASGSYMPSPVKRVDIPKGDGKTRPLGIPTVADRVAQMVVKQAVEPEWDRYFHPDSYGYRPGKSAHQALACIFHHGGEFFDFSGSGSLTGDCVAKIPTLAPSDSMSAEGAWRLILPSVFVSHRHMMASVIQSNTAACLASMQAWDKPRVREALA